MIYQQKIQQTWIPHQCDTEIGYPRRTDRRLVTDHAGAREHETRLNQRWGSLTPGVLVPCRYQSIKLKMLWLRHINARPVPDHETKDGVTRTCCLEMLILGRWGTKPVPSHETEDGVLDSEVHQCQAGGGRAGGGPGRLRAVRPKMGWPTRRDTDARLIPETMRPKMGYLSRLLREPGGGQACQGGSTIF